MTHIFDTFEGEALKEKSVAEHEAEAKARGQELTMTEAQGKEILAGEVDKFHNDLLKVRKKILH